MPTVIASSRLLLPRRATQLFIGLVLYGLADALMIRAAVGVDPWTVFAQGVSLRTGIGIGWLTNVIGLLVLLLWIPLRQRPGIGTVLNILLIGPSIELGLWLIHPATEPWQQILVFTAGLLLLAVASGLYIGSHFGPGPRDGLMTGIHRSTGWPIWVGRTIVEVVVLAAGWLLGGNVGLGTLAFALLIGPLCQWTIPLFAVRLPRAAAADATEAELEGSTAPGAPAVLDSPAI
ncbi:membrane protein YczE [Luethyella okanaganae]|uniref:YitT family protein n=1 Tax=Luethyella okanaganae TaxID=69372 RepID=A0ABW1VDP2_9MICO